MDEKELRWLIPCGFKTHLLLLNRMPFALLSSSSAVYLLTLYSRYSRRNVRKSCKLDTQSQNVLCPMKYLDWIWKICRVAVTREKARWSYGCSLTGQCLTWFTRRAALRCCAPLAPIPLYERFSVVSVCGHRLDIVSGNLMVGGSLDWPARLHWDTLLLPRRSSSVIDAVL